MLFWRKRWIGVTKTAEMAGRRPEDWCTSSVPLKL